MKVIITLLIRALRNTSILIIFNFILFLATSDAISFSNGFTEYKKYFFLILIQITFMTSMLLCIDTQLYIKKIGTHCIKYCYIALMLYSFSFFSISYFFTQYTMFQKYFFQAPKVQILQQYPSFVLFANEQIDETTLQNVVLFTKDNAPFTESVIFSKKAVINPKNYTLNLEKNNKAYNIAIQSNHNINNIYTHLSSQLTNPIITILDIIFKNIIILKDRLHFTTPHIYSIALIITFMSYFFILNCVSIKFFKNLFFSISYTIVNSLLACFFVVKLFFILNLYYKNTTAMQYMLFFITIFGIFSLISLIHYNKINEQ